MRWIRDELSPGLDVIFALSSVMWKLKAAGIMNAYGFELLRKPRTTVMLVLQTGILVDLCEIGVIVTAAERCTDCLLH
jgi:hypothetical protein